MRTPRRDALQRALAAAGIETAVYYPRTVADQPAMRGLPPAHTPNADRYCAEALALPVHECLPDDAVAEVIDRVRGAA